MSGNDYIMVPGAGLDEHVLWQQFSSYRAYDMEAAGFMLAAQSSATPWLVLRGVSDHGTRETRIDRTFASAAAAKLLREFLVAGANAPKRIRAPRPRFSGASLLTRWGGEFRGYMGYFDDDGDLVIYEELGELQQVGQVVTARVRSTVLRGNSKQVTLNYVIDLTVAHDQYAAGAWTSDQSDSRYFGSIVGELGFTHGALGGLWTGTHAEGIRVGRFTWYSMKCEAALRRFATEAGRIQVVEEFTRLFELPPPAEAT